MRTPTRIMTAMSASIAISAMDLPHNPRRDRDEKAKTPQSHQRQNEGFSHE
jgi:hypothetical protein